MREPHHHRNGEAVKKTEIIGSDLVENTWPFEVRLLPTAQLLADPSYQRPPQQSFIAKLVGSFDETLVATLDVSDREDGSYAVLDGLQRLETLKKIGRPNVWCAVYDGMTVADEARFFYRRNRDRRSVHPFYQFRARVLMGEDRAQKIDRIVRGEGFRLNTSAAPDENITAVKATEDAYSYSSLARPESLSVTLHTIRASIFGRKGAKDGELIRGLGRFFQPFYDDELDFPHITEILQEVGPLNLIGRAKDKASGSRHGKSAGYEVARELLAIYNQERKTGKLSARMLTLSGRPK
jgi:hypothetical protein